jgi:pre-mRNA-processing factor 39
MNLGVLVTDRLFPASPPSVALSASPKSGAKENGASAAEMDEATRQKAEARYYSFYQLHMDPSPIMQGTASFN